MSSSTRSAKLSLVPGALFDAVQHKIKNLVVVQRPVFGAPAIRRVEWPREQERHPLFSETAMRAKTMPRQSAEIVILSARPDDRVAVAEHGEIPLSIKRQLELRADLLLIENNFDTRQCSRERHHGPEVGWPAKDAPARTIPVHHDAARRDPRSDRSPAPCQRRNVN